MTSHRPLKLSQATRDAIARGEDRAARAGGTHPSPGQRWTRKADGITMQLAGMKGGGDRLTCAMIPTQTGPDTVSTATAADVIEVDIDTLVDAWSFAGCDHDAACCHLHGTHTSPHKGCVLR